MKEKENEQFIILFSNFENGITPEILDEFGSFMYKGYRFPRAKKNILAEQIYYAKCVTISVLYQVPQAKTSLLVRELSKITSTEHIYSILYRFHLSKGIVLDPFQFGWERLENPMILDMFLTLS